MHSGWCDFHRLLTKSSPLSLQNPIDVQLRTLTLRGAKKLQAGGVIPPHAKV